MEYVFWLCKPDRIVNRYRNDYPEPGRFYVTGFQPRMFNWEMYIGYVVQVRIGRGVNGSHQVFLRHRNGLLRVYSGQTYFRIDPDEERIMIDRFLILPEDEDYTKPFYIGNDFPEYGRIVP